MVALARLMSCVSLLLRLIDIPPFGTGAGDPPARVTGVQAVGLLPILAGWPREVDVRGGTVTGRRLFPWTNILSGLGGKSRYIPGDVGLPLAGGTIATRRCRHRARAARRGAQGAGRRA